MGVFIGIIAFKSPFQYRTKNLEHPRTTFSNTLLCERERERHTEERERERDREKKKREREKASDCSPSHTWVAAPFLNGDVKCPSVCSLHRKSHASERHLNPKHDPAKHKCRTNVPPKEHGQSSGQGIQGFGWI